MDLNKKSIKSMFSHSTFHDLAQRGPLPCRTLAQSFAASIFSNYSGCYSPNWLMAASSEADAPRAGLRCSSKSASASAEDVGLCTMPNVVHGRLGSVKPMKPSYWSVHELCTGPQREDIGTCREILLLASLQKSSLSIFVAVADNRSWHRTLHRARQNSHLAAAV